MSSSLLTGLLGVALGMRHAVEPDHLAAVSTLATEQKNARAGLALGALWGLGHTLSLLVVGGGLALLEAQMPPWVAALFELLVAVMIVVLGVRAVRRSFIEGRAGRTSTHTHGDVEHTHAAPVEHVHLRSWTFATRPLLVGLLHGLAGSGAITALVLAALAWLVPVPRRRPLASAALLVALPALVFYNVRFGAPAAVLALLALADAGLLRPAGNAPS